MCGGGDRIRRAQRSHERRAPSILAEAERRLWRGKSEGEVVERRRQSGVASRRKGGEAKTKVRTDLD
jgi:hypothetical protein